MKKDDYKNQVHPTVYLHNIVKATIEIGEIRATNSESLDITYETENGDHATISLFFDGIILDPIDVTKEVAITRPFTIRGGGVAIKTHSLPFLSKAGEAASK
jgi:hypothetical protein